MCHWPVAVVLKVFPLPAVAAPLGEPSHLVGTLAADLA